MPLLQTPVIGEPDLKACDHIRQYRIRMHRNDLSRFASFLKELPEDLIIPPVRIQYMAHALCHDLQPVQRRIKGMERRFLHRTHHITVERDQIIDRVLLFIIIFLQPDIVIIIVSISDRKQQLLFPMKMMIEYAALST